MMLMFATDVLTVWFLPHDMFSSSHSPFFKSCS